MLNVAALVGRLTADPELKHTSNDLAVTRFNIAVGRSYVKSGSERQTDFIDIVAWRGAAEFVCRYFKKGNLIAVEGSIQTGSYQDKDGNKRRTFEVVASNVHFVESKRDGSDPSGSYQRPEPSNESQAAYSSGNDNDFQKVQSDDDLPF